MPTDLRAGHVTHWMRFSTGPRPALLLHCSLAHCSVWQGLAGSGRVWHGNWPLIFK
jgi:hypothetical protein